MTCAKEKYKISIVDHTEKQTKCGGLCMCKFDVPKLKYQHSGFALVLTF